MATNWFDDTYEDETLSPQAALPAATVPPVRSQRRNPLSLADMYDQSLDTEAAPQYLQSDPLTAAPPAPAGLAQAPTMGLSPVATQPFAQTQPPRVISWEQARKDAEAYESSKPKPEQPIFGLGDVASAAGGFISALPTTGTEAFYRMKEFGKRPDQFSPEAQAAFAESRALQERMAQEQAEREKAGTSTTIGQALREATSSSGYTLGSMLPALAGGVAGAKGGAALGALAGPAGAGIGGVVGGIIGGFAGSGAAAYTMSQNQFMEDAFREAEQRMQQKQKRSLNEQEKQALYQEMEPLARDNALWEAGPEAIGNAFMLTGGGIAAGLLGKQGISKLAAGAMRKGMIRAGAGAAGAGMEFATETATELGQALPRARMEAYLEGRPMEDAVSRYAGKPLGGAGEAFEAIWRPTLGTVLMFGLGGTAVKGVSKANERFRQNPQEADAIVEMANNPDVLAAMPQQSLENLQELSGFLRDQWFAGSKRQENMSEAIAKISAELQQRTTEDATTQRIRRETLGDLWTRMAPQEQSKVLEFFGATQPGVTGWMTKEGAPTGQIDALGLNRLANILGVDGKKFRKRVEQTVQRQREFDEAEGQTAPAGPIVDDFGEPVGGSAPGLSQVTPTQVTPTPAAGPTVAPTDVEPDTVEVADGQPIITVTPGSKAVIELRRQEAAAAGAPVPPLSSMPAPPASQNLARQILSAKNQDVLAQYGNLTPEAYNAYPENVQRAIRARIRALPETQRPATHPALVAPPTPPVAPTVETTPIQPTAPAPIAEAPASIPTVQGEPNDQETPARIGPAIQEPGKQIEPAGSQGPSGPGGVNRTQEVRGQEVQQPIGQGPEGELTNAQQIPAAGAPNGSGGPRPEIRQEGGRPTESGEGVRGRRPEIGAAKESYAQQEGLSNPSGLSQSNSGLLESIPNRIPTNADLFPNRVDRETISVQGFDALDGNRQRVVLGHVAGMLHDDQVVRTVIKSVPIDVVDMLIGKKGATEDVLNNPAMLPNALSIPDNRPIPASARRFVEAMASGPAFPSASPTAIETGLPVEPTGTELPGKSVSATRANQSQSSQNVISYESKIIPESEKQSNIPIQGDQVTQPRNEEKAGEVAPAPTVSPTPPESRDAQERQAKAEAKALLKPGQPPASTGAAATPSKPGKKVTRLSTDEVEKYFSPGRIVPSYGGRRDKVVSFNRTKDGWYATVYAVDAEGNRLDGPDGRDRSHSTMPSVRDYEQVVGEKATGKPLKVQPKSAVAPPAPAQTQKVKTPDEQMEVDVRLEVVDLADLITSDDARFPKSLQPRGRGERQASATQVFDIAKGLNPDRLLSSPVTSDGAPIVGPDGLVESGNGRVMAIRTAYGKFQERADAYRAKLQEQGFDTTGMTAPVLIRRRVSPLDDAQRIEFTQKSNMATVASMSPSERAGLHAKRLLSKPTVLDAYRGGDPGLSVNVEFVRRFFQEVLDPSERGQFQTKEGMLNAEGKKEIQSAILAAAYPDTALLDTLLESQDNNIKTIGGALREIAPDILQTKAYLRHYPELQSLDLSGPLTEAARLVNQTRMENKGLKDVLEQQGMFESIDPTVERLVRLFFVDADLRKWLSQPKLVKILQAYAENARLVQPSDPLFADIQQITVGDLLSTMEKRREAELPAEQADLLGGGAARPIRPTSGPGDQRPSADRPSASDGAPGPREGQEDGGKPAKQEVAPEPGAAESFSQKETRARDLVAKKFLDGEKFSGIAAARKFVYQVMGLEDKPASKKISEEVIEQAVVQTARGIVSNAQTPEIAFKRLVSLYQEQQPNLATRTSESVTDQAYSTPIPLAYLASQLAGIGLNPEAVIVEPTAGNGALLVAANPKQVKANEKNRKRADYLKRQGFDVSQSDATTWRPKEPVDILIANPPFGMVTVDGKKQSWTVPSRIAPEGKYTTTEIDHAIVLQQLSSLKDDGVAVLLVGGVDAPTEAAKKNKYAGKAKRDFYWTLVNDYNVVDMFTVGGDLYARQGAKYPVDVVVIHGRRTAENAAATQPYALPAATLPRVYESWDQLSEVIRNEANDPKWNPALRETQAVAPGTDQSGTPSRNRPDTDERGSRPAGDVAGSPRPVADTDRGGEQGRDGARDRGETVLPGTTPGDDVAAPAGGERGGRVSPDDRGGVAAQPDAVARPSKYGQGNTVFTADAAAAARERLRKKLGQVRSGLDPEMVQDGIILAGYHIEAGARQFAAYAKAMLDDLGDGARNYLRSWYEAARYYPGFDNSGMTPADETDRIWNKMQEDWKAQKKPAAPVSVAPVAPVEAALPAEPAPKKPEAPKEKPSEGQVNYDPASKIGEIGTLIPVNMQVAARNALQNLESRVGPVDAYVASELGYEQKDLGKYFAAEQIDSLGLAIDNLKRGRGYITADQCVAGHTRIFNPKTRQYNTIKSLAEAGNFIHVASMTPDGITCAVALPPFRKGVASLFEVTTQDGRTITVTQHHRFLTPDGWLTIADGLSVGCSLGFFGDPPQKNLEFSRLAHAVNDRHSTKITQDSQCDYPLDYCSYDEPLLAELKSGLSPLPLPSDAGARTHLWSDKDDAATLQEHNHRYQLECLLSKNNSFLTESRDLEPTSDLAPVSYELRLRRTPQDELQSLQLSPDRLAIDVIQYRQLELEAEGVKEFQTLSSIDGHNERWFLQGRQLAALTDLDYKEGISAVRLQGWVGDTDVSCSSGDYTGWCTITQINFVGVDEFFDMWVPGYENYVAEGLINHNTGVGKGRVNAGIMRWALRNGKTPIFVTEKPNLYRDMIRDLRDIGMGQGVTESAQTESLIERILITNAGSSIPMDAAAMEWYSEAEKAKAEGNPRPKQYGKFLKTPTAEKQKADLVKAISDVRLPSNKEIIFTTYDQMNPLDGQRTIRHDFMDAFAGSSVLLLDESHNAGGSGKADPNKFARSKYFRDLVEKVDGAFYSSATFAKRPDVMDLYRRTDMSLAVDNIDRLGETISSGGIPLQQVVSAMLVESGQLLRRERSFDGVQYETPIAPINQQVAENIATSMRKILAFSQAMREVVKGIKDDLRAQAASMGAQAGADLGSAESTSFTSVMHNLIAQFLLGLKSRAAVNQAISALQNGEKPIITVANTLESLLKEYVNDAGINIGDPTDMSFGNLLERYLEKSRMVRERKPFQKSAEPARRLEDHELTPRALRAFNDALKEIRAHDWSDIPSSPIDFMESELVKAGYTVGEITGREFVVDYLWSTPTLQVRGENERGIPGRIRAIQKFNDGNLDVLILNRAGATGLSLHASPNVGSDLRRRHMIIAQAEANIDTHMQMLGRVHRTGQVIAPRYSQLVGNIPAEIRPAAVLAKKMASLNANTTSARSSAVTSKDALDFMNVYGDEAVAAVMFANQDLHRQLGEPLKLNDTGDGFEAADAARIVTGYLPMLPLRAQEQVYRDIESEYRSILETALAMGENKLEALTLEADAREISATQVFDGIPGETSPFAGPARAVVYDIKRQGRSMTQDEIRQELATFAGVADPMAGGALRKKVDSLRENLQKDLVKFLDAEAVHLSEAQMTSLETRAHAIADKVDTVLRTIPPGTSVSAVSGSGNVFYGIVINVERPIKTKNPAVNSAWRIRIAVADSLRVLSLPLTRIEVGSPDQVKIGRLAIEPYDPVMVQNSFDNQEGLSREKRTILEGNLLAAYSQFPHGQIVYFRRAEGDLRQGILMPRSLDFQKVMAAKAAVMQTSADAVAFMADRAKTKYLSGQDGEVILRYLARADRFEMTVPKSKAKGGRWFLNDRLIALSDDGFVSVGNGYRADFSPSRLPAVLDAVYAQLGERMRATDLSQSQQDAAQPDASSRRYSRAADTLTEVNLTQAQARAEAVEALGETNVRHLERNGFAVWLEPKPGARPLPGNNRVYLSSTGQEVVAPADAQAFVDKGVVHLIPSNMRTGALNALLHESAHLMKDERFSEGDRTILRMSHAVLNLAGLRNFIGNPGFQDLAEQVQRMAREGNVVALKALAQAQQVDPNRIAEESVAYLVEYGNPNLPIVRRILAAIRAALYRMGVKMELRPEDVRQLAISALKARAQRNKVEQRKLVRLAELERLYEEKYGDISLGELRVEVLRRMDEETTLEQFRDLVTRMLERRYSFAPAIEVGEATMEEFEAVRAQFQARQAETPFRQWFGKGTPGVTATTDGTPITLYHGTNNPLFTEWDSSRAAEASGHPTSGLGFFMTADKGAAARYGNNLLELYAKIDKPYYLTDADLTRIETRQDAERLRWNLMKQGYDGAVVEAPGAAPYVIAFKPNQIKFTTTEKPTASPDMRYSRQPVIASDAEYLAAVERGDMETAQRMVDEAASASGYTLHRYTAKSDRAFNDVPWMLFSDKKSSVSSGYGANHYVAMDQYAVDVSILVPEIQEAIKAEFGENLSESEIQISDIVNSAGVWDNPDMVQVIWDRVLEPQGILAIRTPDGLIAMEQDRIVKSANPVTRDTTGNVIPLSRRFDATTSDIRYSRPPTPDDARRFLNDIGGMDLEPQPNLIKRIWRNPAAWRQELMRGFADAAGNTRPAWTRLLSRQQIVEMLQESPIAALSKLFEDTARLLDAEKQDGKHKPFDIAKRWREAAAKSRDKGRNFAKLLFFTTLEHVDPTQPLPDRDTFKDDRAYLDAKQSHARATQMLNDLRRTNPVMADLYKEVMDENKRSFAAYHEALQNRLSRGANGIFNAMMDRAKDVTPTGTPKTLTQRLANLANADPAAYDAFVDAVRQRLAKVRMNQADAQAILDTLPDSEQKALLDDIVTDVQGKIKDSMDSLRFIYEQAKILEPYFPLSRWGDYQVYAEKAGEPKPIFSSFTRQQDQRAAIAQLQKEGWTVKVGYDIKEALTANPPADSFLGKMFVTVDEIVSTKKEAAALKDEFYQMYLRSLPELSSRKHFLHRKGIPGFSMDALRGFAQLANSRANAIARLNHSDTLSESLVEMERTLRRAGRDPNQAEAINRAGALLGELQGSYEWMMNPTNATLANRLTSFGFLWHLTNPSTALINLTQLPIATFPALAAQFKAPGRAFSALNKAIKDYGGWKFHGKVAKEDARKRLFDEYDGDLGRMMESPLISSQISRTEAVALAGMSDDAPEFAGGVQGAAAELYRSALYYGGWLYQKAEVANREITVIAAYRMAREEAAEKGLTREQAHDYASEIAYNLMTRTQGDFSLANRPWFMRGNAMRVMFLFRSFAHLMTWNILRDAYQWKKGQTPESRQIARDRLVWTGVSSLVFAGATGFPAYTIIAALANAFWGSDPDDPWDFDTAVRNELQAYGGETFMRTVMSGPVGQAPRVLNLMGLDVRGVDISPRLSLDLARLWFRRQPDDLEGGAAMDWWMAQVAGPLYGTARGLAEGMRYLGQTSYDPQAWFRSIEGFTPAPIRNLAKSVRFKTEGVTSRQGDLLMDDFTYTDMLAQAIGFTPDELQDQYRTNTRAWELKKAIDKRRKNIYSLYIFATERGDAEMQKEAIGRVERWNELNPEYPITYDNLHSSYRKYAQARALQEGGVFIPSHGLRARVFRDLTADED